MGFEVTREGSEISSGIFSCSAMFDMKVFTYDLFKTGPNFFEDFWFNDSVKSSAAI